MKIELPIATVSESVELTICRQFDPMDADYWVLRMHVDNQSFLIGPGGGWDTREEIDMHDRPALHGWRCWCCGRRYEWYWCQRCLQFVVDYTW